MEELIARAEPAADEAFRVVEVGRDANSSHHVVGLRDAETPHRHDRHDLHVVLLRGHGVMRIGDEEKALGAGSVIYVPRGTVHAFRNEARGTSAAYVVYTPAYDGEDRVPAE